MDKLAKRTAVAQRQVARRAKIEIRKEQSNQNNETRVQFRQAFKDLRGNIQASRTAAREAWELGPLAARRDVQSVAVKDFTRTSWAAGGFNMAQQDIAEKRCAWAGGRKQLNLAPQDRVVILDGPDKGKIDLIESIDYDMGFVKLVNYHKVSQIFCPRGSTLLRKLFAVLDKVLICSRRW
jgi:large subunit ribosomal protein L24